MRQKVTFLEILNGISEHFQEAGANRSLCPRTSGGDRLFANSSREQRLFVYSNLHRIIGKLMSHKYMFSFTLQCIRSLQITELTSFWKRSEEVAGGLNWSPNWNNLQKIHHTLNPRSNSLFVGDFMGDEPITAEPV